MYQLEKLAEKHFIGIPIRTSNVTIQNDALTVWGKFHREGIFHKIHNKSNDTVYALYTDYEDDYTKPYTYIVGCEVTSLNEIPKGLVSISTPEKKYAVFSTNGPYPQALVQTWQTIWKAPLQRAYTTDFEIYPPGFDPAKISEIKVCIALNK